MKKFLIFILFSASSIFGQVLPKNFVYLNDLDPTIQLELRYISNHNFIGKPIDGYVNNKGIISLPAAKALLKVQQELKPFGLSLKIYDAYRPQQAVNHFVRWAENLKDTVMKWEFYPKIPKSELFNQGYIASKSGHSRGSTVDLTLADLKTGIPLDMGSPYDYFGVESHPLFDKISSNQKANRLLLRNLMLQNGFKPYENEWWHFTLKKEPFPTKYFNFPIQ